jgi:membrane-bound lytic murein transglycosylase D
MRLTRLLFALVLVVLASVSSATEFARPVTLEPNVRFWTAVFTDYSRDQVVVHDAVDLDKIYHVVDFRSERARGRSDDEIDRLRKRETDRVVGEYRTALKRLDRLGDTGRPLGARERQLVEMFRGDRRPRPYARAAEEIRTQRGIRERFAEGIRRARRYLPQMEELFRQRGLPVALTRLPLIESSFNVRAYSKVGAAGMWQFMRSTGRRYLSVGSLVDERLDPHAATVAAATFLRENYQRLRTWPLAITAYNHGPYGMQRAVESLGTRDIGVIVARYDGRAFGFASRNFYAEFLAAVDVERDADRYFGPVSVSPLPETVRITLTHDVPITAAARIGRTTKGEIAESNPALLSPVTSGRRDIPRGYRLRLPRHGAAGFEGRLASYAAERRATRVARGGSAGRGDGAALSYRARAGDNLTKIAARHGVTISSIQRENKMGRSSLVRVGQVLRIPVRSHRVQRGQTLSHIARRYGVSVTSLRQANGMGRSSLIRTGQVLRIPGSS